MVLVLNQYLTVFNIYKKIKYNEIVFGSDGDQLDQNMTNQLSLKKNILILCGHYKGIDQVRDYLITKEITIGDYVLSEENYQLLSFVMQLLD